MRTSVVRGALVLVLALGVCSISACATVRADDVSMFYDQLSPYGQWVDVDPYGLCWVPADVDAGWRPYTNGYWDWTDDGWCWVSNYDWGWAPFHYGRWFDSPEFGWCWVPGTVWAPAWCMWRFGDDWTGWCPLPPDENFLHGRDFDFDDIDFDDFARWHGFSFCRDRFFTDHDLDRRIEHVARNVSLLADTKNTTVLREEGGIGVNRSFGVDRIERAVGHTISERRIVNAGTGRRAEVAGNELRIFRPTVERGRPSRIPTAVAPKGGQLSQEELLRREEAGRQALEENLRQRREELGRLHSQEMATPPPGRNLEELHQRQQAENRALNEYESRQRQLFENRMARPWPAPRGGAAPRGREDLRGGPGSAGPASPGLEGPVGPAPAAPGGGGPAGRGGDEGRRR